MLRSTRDFKRERTRAKNGDRGTDPHRILRQAFLRPSFAHCGGLSLLHLVIYVILPIVHELAPQKILLVVCRG
jgi:hypothetical protein